MTSLPKKTDDSKIVDILGFFWSLPIDDQKQILEILNKGMEDKEKKQ